MPLAFQLNSKSMLNQLYCELNPTVPSLVCVTYYKFLLILILEGLKL